METQQPETFSEFLGIFIDSLRKRWSESIVKISWSDVLAEIIKDGDIISNLNYVWEHKNVTAEDIAMTVEDRIFPTMVDVEYYALAKESQSFLGQFEKGSIKIKKRFANNWEYVKKKIIDHYINSHSPVVAVFPTKYKEIKI